jgi:hypothetical protein
MALAPRRFNAASRSAGPAQEVAMYPEFAVYLTVNKGASLGISFPSFRHDGQFRCNRDARSTLSSIKGQFRVPSF